jgi:hypothetical protein
VIEAILAATTPKGGAEIGDEAKTFEFFRYSSLGPVPHDSLSRFRWRLKWLGAAGARPPGSRVVVRTAA